MKRKYFIFSAAVVVILLIFVILHERKGDYYTMSVEDAYELLENEDINMTTASLGAAGMNVLNINLLAEGDFIESKDLITVPVDELLDRKFLKRLRKHEGIIVLRSEDMGLATHAWVILTRKGIEQIKILDVLENERLHYTFEPTQ